ncbi:MAG: hypothetical protein H7A46_16825 [Verrucomicrobiales bacterium]|nr:hypothetical protein [Verrucomicrobiales bacterium]
MNRQRAEQLLETATRRCLTAGEREEWDAWLGASGSERTGWEDEMGLSRMLAGLDRPPVSSNFASRVMAALDHEWRVAGRRRTRWFSRAAWLRWRWQAAAGSVAALALALILVQESSHVRARREVVRGAEMLAEAGGVLSVDLLQDFDSIYALPGGPLPSVIEFAAAFDQPVP